MVVERHFSATPHIRPNCFCHQSFLFCFFVFVHPTSQAFPTKGQIRILQCSKSYAICDYPKHYRENRFQRNLSYICVGLHCYEYIYMCLSRCLWNSRCEVICEEGYSVPLHMSSVLICGSSGQWDAPLPTCNGK